MNVNDLKEQYAVCLVSCGECSRGSGFFVEYQHEHFLVTDYHVVFNSASNDFYNEEIVVTSTIQKDTLDSQVVFLLKLEPNVIHANSDSDLIAIKLTSNNMHNQNGAGNIRIAQLSFLSIQSENIEDRWGKPIYLYGYPSSLMPDAPFDMKPFFSSGVISTYDKDERKFVTNIPVYYGNSGCPVFYSDDAGVIHLIGIVQQLIPFKLDWKNPYEMSFVRMDWHNSGYSICLDVNKIIELLTP